MALDSSPQSEGGLDSSWIGGPYQDEVYLALKSMLPSAGGFVARSIKRMHSDAKISRRLPTILPAIQQTGCLTPDFIYFWNGFIEFFLQLKLHLDAMNGSELSRNFTLAKSRRSFLRSQQDTFNTLPFVLKLKSLLHADDFYEINIFYEELESALQLEFQNAMKKWSLPISCHWIRLDLCGQPRVTSIFSFRGAPRFLIPLAFPTFRKGGGRVRLYKRKF